MEIIIFKNIYGLIDDYPVDEIDKKITNDINKVVLDCNTIIFNKTNNYNYIHEIIKNNTHLDNYRWCEIHSTKKLNDILVQNHLFYLLENNLNINHYIIITCKLNKKVYNEFIKTLTLFKNIKVFLIIKELKFYFSRFFDQHILIHQI